MLCAIVCSVATAVLLVGSPSTVLEAKLGKNKDQRAPSDFLPAGAVGHWSVNRNKPLHLCKSNALLGLCSWQFRAAPSATDLEGSLTRPPSSQLSRVQCKQRLQRKPRCSSLGTRKQMANLLLLHVWRLVRRWEPLPSSPLLPAASMCYRTR